jgi:hypothetical protein
MKVINVLAALAIVGISNVEATEATEKDMAMRFDATINPFSHHFQPGHGHFGAAPVARPHAAAAFKLEAFQAVRRGLSSADLQLVAGILKAARGHKRVLTLGFVYEKIRTSSSFEMLSFHIEAYFEHIRRTFEMLYLHVGIHIHTFLKQTVSLSRTTIEVETPHGQVIFEETRAKVTYSIVGLHTFVALIVVMENRESALGYVAEFLKFFRGYCEAFLVAEGAIELITTGLQNLSEIYLWLPSAEEVDDITDEDCSDCDKNVYLEKRVVNDKARTDGKWSAEASGSYHNRQSSKSHIYQRASKEDAAKIIAADKVLQASGLASGDTALILEDLIYASGSNDDDDDEDEEGEKAPATESTIIVV